MFLFGESYVHVIYKNVNHTILLISHPAKMYKQPICLYLMVLFAFSTDKLFVSCGGALGDAISTAAANRYNTHVLPSSEQHHKPALHSEHPASHSQQAVHHTSGGAGSVIGGSNAHAVGSHSTYHQTSGSGHVDHRNSYNLLSEAMSQAVSNEFHAMGSGSADGACQADDLDCYSGNVQDRLGMEAIRTLHRQLDDDDNGNIDLSESDDFLREELKYDSGYEKRQKAFHFNDDMHISVKELWEAWLRSEVHNWTIEQTTDWLAQSVQLPQYVDLFKQHVVTGAALPRLAVNNMHYVSNVLGIKDPIHKQKIALKAMDVVLFGPPRETGTKWKDYILVTLLLSAIIGCWYAYQQNKNAKRHLRRMAQDMEGLQRAEQSLQEMQKELERARMEQENVATEKLDLERRLKEAPALSSSNSDLEVQKLKKEIEMLRTELSRAEIELVDNCWSPPPQLQSWLQYTYELESKSHLKKRMSAEKQLQCAREACEKLRKKRSSLVGAFVSTHGKSIDDVDRSIVEARTSLGEVTNELQERLHRWKQIESCLGLNIVNNNGLAYLESVLYGRGNGSNKSSRGRMTSSTDDLDDESVQGFHDNYSRISAPGGVIGSSANTIRDDSSCSDDGADAQSVQFYLGGTSTPISNATPTTNSPSHRPLHSLDVFNHVGNSVVPSTPVTTSVTMASVPLTTVPTSAQPQQSPITPIPPPLPIHNAHSNLARSDSIHNVLGEEGRHSPSASSERSIPVPPRSKKQILPPTVPPPPNGPIGKAPLPPPLKSSDPKVQTWCQWKFIRTSQSNTSQQQQSPAVSLVHNNQPLLEFPQSHQEQVHQLNELALGKWSSSTALQANSPHLPHHPPCNLHLQMQPTRQTEGINLQFSLTSPRTNDPEMQVKASHSTRTPYHPLSLNTPSACSLCAESRYMAAVPAPTMSSVLPTPPHLRRLVRRHTVIPKWSHQSISQKQLSAQVLMLETSRKDEEGYVFRSVEKSQHQTAAVPKPNHQLHSSHSANCLLDGWSVLKRRYEATRLTEKETL